MLDAYALVQAQETLQLNDAQYGDVRRTAEEAAGNAAEESAARAISSSRSSGSCRRRRRRRRSTRPRFAIGSRRCASTTIASAAELRRAYDALDEVLDVRQQARFRIFEEMIERRKLDLLHAGPAAGRRVGAERSSTRKLADLATIGSMRRRSVVLAARRLARAPAPLAAQASADESRTPTASSPSSPRSSRSATHRAAQEPRSTRPRPSPTSR